MTENDDIAAAFRRMAQTNRFVEALRECTLTDTEKRARLRDRIHELRASHCVRVSVNCDDGDCGWNGISRRCNCDNRRMFWSWDEGAKRWYPEAY